MSRSLSFSISCKLKLMNMLASGAAPVLASSAFFFYDFHTFRKDRLRQLPTEADCRVELGIGCRLSRIRNRPKLTKLSACCALRLTSCMPLSARRVVLSLPSTDGIALPVSARHRSINRTSVDFKIKNDEFRLLNRLSTGATVRRCGQTERYPGLRTRSFGDRIAHDHVRAFSSLNI
jgi:hypothetical protein